MSIWDKLRHFTYEEAWGDPGRMDHDFLLLLDLYRGRMGTPFVVTCGFETSGHAENSMHYKGRAVDGRFYGPDGPLSLGDHIGLCLRAPFTGIGIYTWSKNGPFVHFDNREIKGERKIWVCETRGIYQPFSEHFLENYFS